jgi:hypothetical protein
MGGEMMCVGGWEAKGGWGGWHGDDCCTRWLGSRGTLADEQQQQQEGNLRTVATCSSARASQAGAALALLRRSARHCCPECCMDSRARPPVSNLMCWPGLAHPAHTCALSHAVHVCMSRAAAQWQCICSYLASGYGASRELYSWPQAPARQPQRPPSQAPVELAPCPGALLTPTAAAARSRQQQQGTQSWQGPRRGS